MVFRHAAFAPSPCTLKSFNLPLPRARESMRLPESALSFGPDSEVQISDVSSVSKAVVFDPVVNVPALASFLVIALVFSLLQFRINAIGHAVIRRKVALNELRTLKSMELSLDGEDRPNEKVLSDATKEYEAALREEESLRTVIPGVRLVAPNAPGNTKEDVDAAKRFLCLDLQPGSSREADQSDDKKERGGELSKGAIAVLGVVALSQVALLVMLSFDPMTASNTFTSIGGGESSAGISSSSW